ncbi:glyoxal/methylglyoxal oxidase [Microdochium nivale]|nr:glyoxal/methylglyoxal oxidase [Microdochium nivale]
MGSASIRRAGFVIAAHLFLASAQLTVPNTLPGSWTYQGCWTDVGRTIDAAATAADDMTIQKCINFCDTAGYPYAGLEYFKECFCGTQLAPAAAKATAESQCNTPCAGDTTQPCGGPSRLSLFRDPTKFGPQPNTGIKDWPHLGCYTEGQNARALPYGAGIPGNTMTGQNCTKACQTAGYKLAGTEYSGECYCGNDILNGAVPATSGCDMRCNGNSTEICGGGNRLNIYDFMGQYAAVHGLASSSSSVASTSTSAAASTTSSAATSTTSSAIATASAAVSTTSSVPSTTSSSAIATSSVAANNGFPANWTYQGCWRDGPGPRIMPTFQAPDDTTLTRQKCAQVCFGRGYNISGTEYFRQCFCSNAIYNGGVQAADESGCQTPCDGDQTQMCGGGGYLSIWANGKPPVYQPPSVKTTGLNNTWGYQGCYVATANNERVMPWQIILPNTNSPQECLSRCGQFGYAAGGMEYGEECYCGDPSDIINAGVAKRPEAECNMPCSGDPTALCGGGARQTLYYWNGTTPLYSFKYPTGNNAGRYSNLVPGLVVPLMTMQSVNGKVTFLEKGGTGAPNSTGAYELDLSLVNDFGKTWREMHIKTDVFCSAGVILPDKAGRQLTIGGWSLDSTFGVRLYTPDGALGQNGTNDWEENVNVLRLQQGRWYPSAMVMTNGSVLVVGGEIGSNDRPVPTLEILPFTGGKPLYMDWLERTDPNNLYPFLAVLPGGGIFVQYWNEARILDEKTFATIKILPNAPGGVTDPKAGRTYPLEGTSVLLPQRAPYSEPLGILICGGATTTSYALDNCVSIQPDAANPTWTMERMPSKRVMSCMAPLPDGTYLILNGAQQGVAGFGLANTPNLNAVLYDPEQPLGQRMSVMANTTVARMYHSEAITLLDGRVLVTGSDPQDGVNPQEVRVEVFTPPYLLTGAARPAFTVPTASKDWTYGQSYTINLGQGAGGAEKISLLGSVSSTHGNSMGARTLFPAFSCSGNTCTITAPPNAYICPPGWYQLFYIRNGVPAVGSYVRIGGDPAALGNWPLGRDFTRPGV